ncbi:MAG TPA: DUF2231 domain-containing protein [Casimicrobiaceae bacterium]
MASRASIAGHPIHPMLVPLPIGLFVFSLVCDLIFMGSGDPVWTTVALYTTGGGIVGAFLAAVFGLVDLLSLQPSKAKDIGVWHMVINLTVVALFVVNFFLRLGAPPGAGLPVLLSLIGVGLLGVSGWLGGEMVFVHGVAAARERESGSR